MTDPRIDTSMTVRAKVLRGLRYLLLIIALSMLAYLIAQVGPRQIVTHLGQLQLGWTLLTLLCIAVNFCFASLRYRLLLATDTRFFNVLEVVLASFLLNYASLIQGLGLGAKIGMLKARDVPISHSSAGIWLEVSLDIVFCSAAVGLAPLVVEFDGSSSALLLLPLLVLLGSGLLALALHRFGGRWPAIGRFLGAMRSVASWPRVGGACLCTAGIWLAAGAGFFCMLNAMSASGAVDLGLSVLALTSGFLTGLASMVPGGLGVRELTWSYVVSQAGYPLEIAGLSAVLYRLLSIALVAAVVAMTSLVRGRSSPDGRA